VPLTFEISMGVHKGNAALKARLESAIDHRQAEIRAVLEDYGVPLLPLMASAAPAGRAQARSHSRLRPRLPRRLTRRLPLRLRPRARLPCSAPRRTGRRSSIRSRQGRHDHRGQSALLQAWMPGVPRRRWRRRHGRAAHRRGVKFGSDDQTLYNLIKGQIPKQTMPTAYANLPDDDLWKILSFIRSVYAGDPAKINW
jgi:hypothetical protein